EGGLLDGCWSCVDGFGGRGFLEGSAIREHHDAALGDPRHGLDVFGEAAAVGGEPGGQASGFVLLALGGQATVAIKALAARDVMEAHDAVAGLPLRDARADCD